MPSADLAARWALLAYADKQHAHITSECRAAAETGPVKMLISDMKMMPPLKSGVFEMAHVQALLLVALNSIGSQWNQAWVIIGHAVRIALEINIGQVPGRGSVFYSDVSS